MPYARVADPRRGGHVLERAVATVPVQAMARAARHRRIGERSAVHEKDIEPAVLVEVEEEAARAHDLGEVLLVAGAVDVDEVEAA